MTTKRHKLSFYWKDEKEMDETDYDGTKKKKTIRLLYTRIAGFSLTISYD